VIQPVDKKKNKKKIKKKNNNNGKHFSQVNAFFVETGQQDWKKILLANDSKRDIILKLTHVESCPSGRRSTIGNRVYVNLVSRVQIPCSPPYDSFIYSSWSSS
jgi:hypothetical protein